MALWTGSVVHLTATAGVGQNAAESARKNLYARLETRQRSVPNDSENVGESEGVLARNVALWAERQRVAQRRYFLDLSPGEQSLLSERNGCVALSILGVRDVAVYWCSPLR